MEIAIVGAGFSGTLVAAHLLRKAAGPLTVRLIERAPHQFGRGVAYSTVRDCHFLNVPAAKMSAFPDDAEHFLRWARAREHQLINPPWVTAITPASFLPRRAYGDYLCGVLDEAERGASAGVRLERKTGEAVGLKRGPRGISLHLAGGERLEVERVVLALGNFHPGDPNVGDRSFYESDRYHGDPWGPEVLAALMETRSCLAIGSGLTMADWAITLSEAGYRGTLHVLSRRGVWPQAHRPAAPVDFSIAAEAWPRAVGAWLRHIRHYIRSQRCDWRATDRRPAAGNADLVGEPATRGATAFPAPPAPLLGLSPASARAIRGRPPAGTDRVRAIGPPCRPRHGLSGGRERRRCRDQAARPR